MRLIFEHHFEGKIFKILPQRETYALEIRKTATQEVTFSVLALAPAPHFLFENIGLAEAWLVSIVAFEANYLIFQHFTSKPLPETKGMTAVETTTQKILWHYSHLYFDYADSRNVYAYHWVGNEKKCVCIEIATGEMSSEQLTPYIEPFTVSNPQTYTPENEHFNIFETLVKNLGVDLPLQRIDYTEIENYAVLQAQFAPPQQHAWLLNVQTHEIIWHEFVENIQENIFWVQAPKLFWVFPDNVLRIFVI